MCLEEGTTPPHTIKQTKLTRQHVVQLNENWPTEFKKSILLKNRENIQTVHLSLN